MKNLLRPYEALFNFISLNRVKNKDIDLTAIHIHLLTVLSTSVLMWLYTAIAIIYMTNPIPGLIGVVCSLVHLLSPLTFRWSKNIFLASTIALLPGIIHQTSFSCFSGGFMSSALIWYGVFPIHAGLTCGKKAVLIWSIIVTIVALCLLGMEVNGYPFQDMLLPQGNLFTHSISIFGLIFAGSIILYFYAALTNSHSKEIQEHHNKINLLTRILMHDMSNSIQALRGSASLLLKDKDTNKNQQRQSEIINKHSLFLSDTTRSIKALFLVDSVNDKLKLEKVDLNESLRFIFNILENKINQKQLVINLSFNNACFILAAPHVLENQVIHNILLNAIQYSFESGQIDIEVHEVNNTSLIELVVRDYGTGMEPEILKNIFNPKELNAIKKITKTPGSGAGMFILKDIVERMQGSVSVQSTKDIGTIVTVRFLKAT
ncbi:MAG: HAMP domain-containing histidine kinase [Halobacteriovoraceae bacterium]|jgi:signal transduction histidine kinase|nr:HAMP domain-containing histidine kinase [Halobacteriovoraceae bacterium]